MRALLTAVLILGFIGMWPGRAEAAAPVAKRLAVVVIQNGDTDAERAQLANTTYFDTIFFDSLPAWMQAVTHGQLTYVPAGGGVFLAEPNDELRNGDPDECHSGPARTTAEDHMKAIGLAWDALAVVFDIGRCPWAGLGQMPGKITWYPPKPSLSAIVHEFGHNQGYPHQGKTDCTGGSMAACKTNGYSGNTPMGSGGASKGYSSVELLHSGWLGPGWHTRTSTPGVFTLKPLYSPASVTGTRVVEFKAGSTLSYVIETRAPASGVDSGVTNPGVRVYTVSNGRYKDAQMINPGAGGRAPMVPAGSTITDAASKLKITVKSSSASGATVAIEAIGAKPSPSPTPTGSPSPVVPSADPPAHQSPDLESGFRLADAPPTSPRQPMSWIPVVIATAGALLLMGAGAAFARRVAAARWHPRHRHPD